MIAFANPQRHQQNTSAHHLFSSLPYICTDKCAGVFVCVYDMNANTQSVWKKRRDGKNHTCSLRCSMALQKRLNAQWGENIPQNDVYKQIHRTNAHKQTYTVTGQQPEKETLNERANIRFAHGRRKKDQTFQQTYQRKKSGWKRDPN